MNLLPCGTFRASWDTSQSNINQFYMSGIKVYNNRKDNCVICAQIGNIDGSILGLKAINTLRELSLLRNDEIGDERNGNVQ